MFDFIVDFLDSFIALLSVIYLIILGIMFFCGFGFFVFEVIQLVIGYIIYKNNAPERCGYLCVWTRNTAIGFPCLALGVFGAFIACILRLWLMSR